MPFRPYLYLGAVIGIALGLFLIRLWQPERQVSQHSAHLLHSLADKNWAKFAAFIADNYHDQWDNDRTALLQRTREIFRYLRDVKISPVDPNIRVEGRQGYWRGRILIAGKEENEVMS